MRSVLCFLEVYFDINGGVTNRIAIEKYYYPRRNYISPILLDLFGGLPKTNLLYNHKGFFHRRPHFAAFASIFIVRI